MSSEFESELKQSFPEEIINSIDANVKRHVGQAEQPDDKTMLFLRYNG